MPVFIDRIALSKIRFSYRNFKEIVIEKKLREQNFGEWQGKKISLVWEEIKKFKTKINQY